MAKLLKVFQQEFDNAGDPNVSGTITVYNHGTLDLSDIFSSEDGETPIPNPVTLGSSGRVNLYVGSGFYDAVLKDSSGNTLAQTTGIPGDVGFGSGTVTTVGTINELMGLASGVTSYVDVTGYYTAGDGKAFLRYYWNASSSATHNGGTVIKPSSDPVLGRWLAVTDGTIRVCEFGAKNDNSTDNTSILQTVLNLGGHIIFDGGGTYITGELTPISNSYIEIKDGTIIKQRTSDLTASGAQNIFLLRNVENVEIDGNTNGVISGQRANNSEFRMCVRVDKTTAGECRNIYVHDLICKDVDGDGLYIASAENALNTTPQDVIFENVQTDNCRRQGLSIIFAKNLLVTGCTFKNTTGTDPQSGIDIEPDSDYGVLENIVIENTVCDGNSGNGLIMQLVKVDTNDSNKNTSIYVNNCRFINNEHNGIRINGLGTTTGRGLIVLKNNECTGNGQQGLKLANNAIQSQIIIDGLKLLNNCSETTDADWEFPAWTGAASVPEAKTDILIYTNTVSAYDAYNGGLGLISGNIQLKNIEVIQTSRDSNVLRIDNFNQADGAASGTARAPIRNVTIDGLLIRTPSGKLWSWDADYAEDILITNAQVFNSTTYRWEDALQSKTSNYTLANATDQGLETNNTGASGIVTFTLPGAESTDQRKQRFKIKVTNANGIKVSRAGDDILYTEEGSFTSLTSFNVGAELEISKHDVSSWMVRKIGDWIGNINEIADADYTVLNRDLNGTISDVNWTANRTVQLPAISANNVGFQVTFVCRNSTYFMRIDTDNADQILGLTTATGKRIQASGIGSSITLKAINASGGGTWVAVSINGGWYDIDGLGNVYRHNGNFRANGRMLGNQGSDVASANNISLGTGNAFLVTGTTQINTISATDWTSGSEVTLVFSGALTVKHNTAGTGALIKLQGSADFTTSAGAILKLMYNGTDWVQSAGSVTF